MTNKYKPGSRIAQVFDAFTGQGPQAAFDFGLTLNLAAGTLKSWLRVWGKESGAPTVSLEGERKVSVAKTMKREAIKVSYSKREAFLIEQGPQVSRVRWAHTGEDQYISNEFLGLETVQAEVKPINRRNFED